MKGWVRNCWWRCWEAPTSGEKLGAAGCGPYVDRERTSFLGRCPEGSTPLLRGAPGLHSFPRAWLHFCLPVRLSPRTQDGSRDDYSKSPACEPACCELSKMRTCAPMPPSGSPFEASHPGMWPFLLGFATSDLTGFLSPLHLESSLTSITKGSLA